MTRNKKIALIAVCLVVAVLGTYFLIKPHGLTRYVTDSSFEYEEIDGGVVLTKYTGKNKNVIVPAKIDGKTVLSLKGAFFGNSTVENVRISEGIRAVDYMTFWHCISLESVELPDSVETVGHAAFNKCIGLKKVRLGKNLVNIMPYAFSGCELLSDISLPEGLRFIGENAFENCSDIKRLTVPASVEVIGGVTEQGASDGDRAYSYSEQVGSVERDSFPGCDALKLEIADANPYYIIESGEICQKQGE